MILREGVPQVGLLTGSHTEALYVFEPIDPLQKGEVTITLTPQYGDPDLFVTDKGNLSEPIWTSEKWYGLSLAGAHVMMLTRSAHLALCVHPTHTDPHRRQYTHPCARGHTPTRTPRKLAGARIP